MVIAKMDSFLLHSSARTAELEKPSMRPTQPAAEIASHASGINYERLVSTSE